MLKGAQKQMIVIRTGSSRYFDEAYFVLRRDVHPGRREQGDLLSEADRILRESETVKSVKNRHRKRSAILFFGLGLLLGAAVAVLICLLC